MPLEINTGMERVIDVFNEGWAFGALRDEPRPPRTIDPALHEYWLDGFHAGRDDRQKLLAPMPSVQ